MNRLGFLTLPQALRLNGYCLKDSHKQDLIDLTLRIASEPITKEEIAGHLEKWSTP